jgi:hypothetical protein
MSKVVVALYDNFEHARMAVEELVNNGFRRDEVSLVASDDKGDFKRYLDTPHGEEAEDIGEGAAAGAGIGATLGGIGGLLVGLGVLAIPGIGPVLAAGPLVTALAGAGIGAAAGGLLGALTQVGVPEEHARDYVEGVRHGNVLVTITAADDRASQAVNILNRHNPIDVDRRSSEWRSDSSRIEHSVVEEKPYPSTTNEPYGTPDRPVGFAEERDINRSTANEPYGTPERPVGFSDDENVVRNTTEEPYGTPERPVGFPEDQDVPRSNVDEPYGTPERPVGFSEPIDTPDLPQGRRNETGWTGPGMASFMDYDDAFHSHYNTNYANTSYTYEQYRPYYEYGYQLANDERYRNRTWDEIEMDARRDWERRNPNSMWDEFKMAIREGWNAIRGRD